MESAVVFEKIRPRAARAPSRPVSWPADPDRACSACVAVHNYSITIRFGIRTWVSNRRDARLPPIAGEALPTHRSTRRYRIISRPSLPCATTTGRMSASRRTPSASCGPTWSVESWPMASPGRVARSVDTISWSPSPARAAASAPHATPGAGSRDCSPTWWIMSCLACRFAKAGLVPAQAAALLPPT